MTALQQSIKDAQIDLIDGEEWRPVVGFELCYDVSSLGRVRRNQNASTKSTTFPGRILTSSADSSTGYHRVTLHSKGRKQREQVHRLVARAFIEGFEPGRHVNHKNGIKTDNRVENLEWCSARENVLHAWRMGLNTPNRGEQSGRSTLKDQDVRIISFLLSRGVQAAILAEAFGVTGANISSIKRGQSWTHITKE